MNFLRQLTISISAIFLLCFNTAICSADDLVWLQNKEEVFKLAKEQDKYIYLFVGKTNCSICQSTLKNLNSDPTLRPIIDDNYILWYSLRTNPAHVAEIKVYTEEFDKVAKYMPFLYVIDPEDPDKSQTSNWGPQSISSLEKMLSFDLIPKEGLKWYEDKEEVLELAKEQDKLIFMLVGRGTSNNCKKVMAHLNEEPVRQILEENFILWYSQYEDPDIEIPTETYAGGSEEESQTPPYLYIIDPTEPDKSLSYATGYQDADQLEDMIKSSMVSNEQIDWQENNIFISGNILYISNNQSNEQINIYTISGQKIAGFLKNDVDITKDASGYPKGILIIQSSKGWNAKIMNR